MTTAFSFWEAKHRQYIAKEWIAQPNFFVQEVVRSLVTGSRVLDLGCGQGQDAVFMADQGHDITAGDLSEFALSHFPERATELGVRVIQLDMSKLPYPFAPGTFDAVYSHLSLHYFGDRCTRDIFREVSRILKPNGRFFSLFNSVRDPEFGTGIQLESQFYELAPGDQKRFFSVEEMRGLLGPDFIVERAEYGTGTRKNKNDQFVLLIAKNADSEEGADNA